MRIELTTDQAAQLAPLMRPGWTMLAGLDREQFDGSNAATSGRMRLVFTTIPDDWLDMLRAAIAGEAEPALAKRRKVKP